MDAADAIIPEHPKKDRNKVSGLQGNCEILAEIAF